MVDTPLFIDINGIDDLRGITETSNGGLRIGALTRHFELEVSPLIQERYPLLHEAMKYVAHLAIRNRGTIGGSISHADPAAELPALAVLLDAMIVARGPRERDKFRLVISLRPRLQHRLRQTKLSRPWSCPHCQKIVAGGLKSLPNAMEILRLSGLPHWSVNTARVYLFLAPTTHRCGQERQKSIWIR